MINDFAAVTQYSYTGNASAKQTQFQQMWKVKHIGDGLYTIRPYHKLDMCLYAYGPNDRVYIRPKTADSSTNNTQSGYVSAQYRWSIEYIGSGVVIRNDGERDATLQIQNDSTAQDARIRADTYGSTNTCYWTFTTVTNPGSGVILYDTDEQMPLNGLVESVDPGQTVSLFELKLSLSPYSNTTDSYSVFWYTNNPNIALVNNSNGNVTGVSPGVATITAQVYIGTEEYNSSYQVKVNNNAIIIVPGIMGTQLVAGPNNSNYAEGTPIWHEELANGFFTDFFDTAGALTKLYSLKCHENGNSINDIVPYNNSYGAGDVYEVLYDTLFDEYSKQYTIEFFAYDWRLSNTISANKLDEFINNQEYDNVILVCHSMGGLVASKYLSLGETQRNKIKTVITLGSPLLGTSAIPYLWGSEDLSILGLFGQTNTTDTQADLINLVMLCANPINNLIGNYSSMYEMFPTEKYFDSSFAGKNYLITSQAGFFEDTITTYNETREVLEETLNHYNTDLANNAELFHNSLYVNDIHVTQLVDTYYIAGYNSQTIDMIEYNHVIWDVETRTPFGDSLVAEWSATLGDKYSSQTYFVNGVNHGGLVTNMQVVNFIIQLIDGNTDTTAFVKIDGDMDEGA